MQTSDTPALLALRILNEGRGRGRPRPGSPTHESSAGRGGAFLGRKAVHRPSGGRGARLRVVNPSSARQPASVIWTRATSIFDSQFSTVSIRTVASSLWTRSASVSSLKPEGEQTIHVAAMRRNRQDFEYFAMSFDESRVFGLRGHFCFPPPSRRHSRRAVAKPSLSRSAAIVAQPTQANYIHRKSRSNRRTNSVICSNSRYARAAQRLAGLRTLIQTRHGPGPYVPSTFL